MRLQRPVKISALFLVLALAGAGCVIELGDASPLAQRVERELDESFALDSGAPVKIRNLAGLARVTSVDGTEVTVRATVVAGGDDEAAARELVDTISLRRTDEDGAVVLTVVYPVDEYSSFHYDGEHESGVASWFGSSNSRIEYLDRRVSVSTRRSSGAASVHANLEIGVPRGASLHVLNAIGRVHADDVDGELSLVVYSGGIEVRGGEGALTADTGSGGVSVENRRGGVVADTGSGSVTVRDVNGEVRVDTGSGGVSVERVEGPFVGVDTGSGSVSLREIRAALDVNTGSGSVQGEDLIVGARLRVDTGSGRIRLAGDFSALERGDLETGSGGVTLRMSAWPGLELDLRTGSGGINVDLPGLRTERSGRDVFRGSVGDDPSARLVVSTSSGGIRVSSD